MVTVQTDLLEELSWEEGQRKLNKMAAKSHIPANWNPTAYLPDQFSKGGGLKQLGR